MNETFTPIRTAEEATDAVKELAETIYEGWWENEPRIDWQAFIDRMELMGHYDFGSSMDSPAIKEIKKHIKKVRSE